MPSIKVREDGVHIARTFPDFTTGSNVHACKHTASAQAALAAFAAKNAHINENYIL